MRAFRIRPRALRVRAVSLSGLLRRDETLEDGGREVSARPVPHTRRAALLAPQIRRAQRTERSLRRNHSARSARSERAQRTTGLRRPVARSARPLESAIWTGFGPEAVSFCGNRSFPGLSPIGVPRFELWTPRFDRNRLRLTNAVRSARLRGSRRFRACLALTSLDSARHAIWTGFGPDGRASSRSRTARRQNRRQKGRKRERFTLS